MEDLKPQLKKKETNLYGYISSMGTTAKGSRDRIFYTIRRIPI